ncbi:MAG: hypothetical protein ACRDYZ_01600 [Acidimicrobiales bacterium]
MGSPSDAAAMPGCWPIPREDFPTRRWATDVSPTMPSTSSIRRRSMPLPSFAAGRRPRRHLASADEAGLRAGGWPARAGTHARLADG